MLNNIYINYTIMPPVDYLLTPEQQKIYDELIKKFEKGECSEELEMLLPNDIQYELLTKFISREPEIEYILYDGVYAKQGDKHTIDEFMEAMYCVGKHAYKYRWPVLVAAMGAGVVWKNK
jgi:hypothetical protein